MPQGRQAAPVPSPRPPPKVPRVAKPTAPIRAPVDRDTTPPARRHSQIPDRRGERRLSGSTERVDCDIQTLCMILAYSGCRLSEALALTVDRVHLGAGAAEPEETPRRPLSGRAGVPALLDALTWCMASASCKPSGERDAARNGGHLHGKCGRTQVWKRVDKRGGRSGSPRAERPPPARK